MDKKFRTAITLAALLAAMILIATFSGCASNLADSKTQFIASQKTYCTVVDSLTLLKTQGRFGEKDTANITIAVHEGADFLTRWKAAIDAGQPTLDYYAEFQGVLDRLLMYQIQQE